MGCPDDVGRAGKSSSQKDSYHQNGMIENEYLRTRRKKINFHEVLMDVEMDLIGLFFTRYGQVEEDKSVKGKADIITENIILNILIYRGRR